MPSIVRNPEEPIFKNVVSLELLIAQAKHAYADGLWINYSSVNVKIEHHINILAISGVPIIREYPYRAKTSYEVLELTIKNAIVEKDKIQKNSNIPDEEKIKFLSKLNPGFPKQTFAQDLIEIMEFKKRIEEWEYNVFFSQNQAPVFMSDSKLPLLPARKLFRARRSNTQERELDTSSIMPMFDEDVTHVKTGKWNKTRHKFRPKPYLIFKK